MTTPAEQWEEVRRLLERLSPEEFNRYAEIMELTVWPVLDDEPERGQ